MSSSKYLFIFMECVVLVFKCVFGSFFTLAVDNFILKRIGNVRLCTVSRLLMYWSPINLSLGYSHKAKSLPDVLGN